MGNPKVLVVDDDQAIGEMIGIVLRAHSFEPQICLDGVAALEQMNSFNPDIVLLDVMLPGINGIDVCRRIRQTSLVPIIMLTARSDTRDVVEGLEAGADDYLTKPFEPDELIARINARVRRLETPNLERYNIGDVLIDISGHQVMRGGVEIKLTPTEFDLLVTMVRNPWKVFSRQDLLAEVWGYEDEGADTRMVNTHVQRLRSKIEVDPENPRIIFTVRGVGYRAALS